MKILEVTAFSSGICGVWTRVFAESKLLAKKGHQVYVFSSNIHRGSEKKELAKDEEVLDEVHIKRFNPSGSFGKNTFFWKFEKEALELKPEIIITHAYRQYYSTNALKIAKRLNIPCILVTHAPFLEKKLRSWKENFMVWFYDNFFGKRLLNQYSKIFTITKWEIPYLKDLGVEENKIVYTPNGVPEDFFKIPIRNKKKSKIKEILFFGRIAPIKDLETLVKAVKLVLDKFPKAYLKFVGPAEESYLEKIKNLVKELNLSDKISFSGPIYDLKEKIKILDECDIFVLPSKREGMPQALIETMAREKIVISSTTDGGKEIIENGKNGYLFDIGNANQLAEKITLALSKNQRKIQKTARNSVKQFSWKSLIEKTENILTSEVRNNQQQSL